MTRQTIDIGGMTCGHCLSRVRAALAALPGVTIAQAIADAGYDVLQTR